MCGSTPIKTNKTQIGMGASSPLKISFILLKKIILSVLLIIIAVISNTTKANVQSLIN